MSNQDMNLNDVLPADEQSAILTAAVLGHFDTKWAELQGIIAQLLGYTLAQRIAAAYN